MGIITINIVLLILVVFFPRYNWISVLSFYFIASPIIWLSLHNLNRFDLINPVKLLVVGFGFFLYLAPLLSWLFFDIKYRPLILFSLSISLALLVCGSLIANKIFNSYKEKLTNTNNISIKYLKGFKLILGGTSLIKGWKWKYIVLFVYLLGVAINFHYFFSLGFIPVLHPDAENMRVIAKEGNGKALILTYALLSSACAMYQIYNHNNGKRVSFIPFIIATILLFGFGYRGLPAQLILDNIIVGIIIKNVKINKTKLSLVGLLFFIGLAIIGFIRAGNSLDGQFSINTLLIPTAWSFSVNLVNYRDYFEAFYLNDVILYGKSYLIELSTILPGYQPNFGMFLKDYLNRDFAGEGMTLTLFGEFLINFGLVGLFICIFIIGFLGEMLFLITIFHNKKRNELLFVFLIIIYSKSIRIITGGIMAITLYYILPIFMVFLLVILLNVLFQLYKNNSSKSILRGK